jgi:hypothetical protein
LPVVQKGYRITVLEFSSLRRRLYFESFRRRYGPTDLDCRTMEWYHSPIYQLARLQQLSSHRVLDPDDEESLYKSSAIE